jgi:hypothetical protein
MKARLLVIAALLIGLTGYAQNAKFFYGAYGSVKTVVEWNGIKVPDHTVLGIRIVADKAIYGGGLSYEDWVAVAPEVETQFAELVDRCADGANKRMIRSGQNIYFTSRVEGRAFMVTFVLRQVSRQGDSVADVTIETPGGEQAIILTLKGGGGTHGSFFNLMGDGMESLGYELGKLMSKAHFYNKI